MSNKKRAIEKANLLLERRFLVEAETGKSNATADKDGNLWFVGKDPKNSIMFRIFIQIKGTNESIMAKDVKDKNPELWGKIYKYSAYFEEYPKEADANNAVTWILNQLSGTQTNTGTSGTAGTAGMSGDSTPAPAAPTKGKTAIDDFEITADELRQGMSGRLQQLGLASQ